jgi:hypothetical protein
MEFESSYGGGTIKPAQFLAEKMCERRAAKEGTKLPQRFWILPTMEDENSPFKLFMLIPF